MAENRAGESLRKTWRRNRRGAIMEEESLRRNHLGGGIELES